MWLRRVKLVNEVEWKVLQAAAHSLINRLFGGGLMELVDRNYSEDGAKLQICEVLRTRLGVRRATVSKQYTQ